MITFRLVIFSSLTSIIIGAAPGQSQTIAPEPNPWSVRPSLYLLGSIDRSTDFPFGLLTGEPGDQSPAPNLAAVLELQGDAGIARIRAGGFALARGPFSTGRRSYFIAARMRASVPLSDHWRLRFEDTAKLQRRPQLDVSNFQRNEFIGGVEWRATEQSGLSIQISDRRRTLAALPELGFTRDGTRVGWFFPVGQHARGELGPVFQHYNSITATGNRAGASADFAAFDDVTIVSLRYAWFTPFNDRRHPDGFPNATSDPEFDDVARAEFFELAALQGDDAELAGESFFLDPIESDSDEWDFGRRKHVVALLVSRRTTSRLTLSGFFRYQHKHGPSFLASESTAIDEADNRFATRGTARYRLTKRLSLVAQASFLRNSGDHEFANFRRTLIAAGLHLQF